MIAKIVLLEVAIVCFVASTVAMQYSVDKDRVEAAFMCGLASVLCLAGSAVMFGAIASEMFS